MKDNHLTDETLQAFLLKEIQDDTIDMHLAECDVCSAKIESYKHFLAQIDTITAEQFSFDVTTVVMQKIEKYEVQEKRNHRLIFGGIMIALIGGMVVLGLPFIPPIIQAFDTNPFLTNLFIIGTGLCVMLFFVIDMYKQYTIKEKIVFDNNLQPTS